LGEPDFLSTVGDDKALAAIVCCVPSETAGNAESGLQSSGAQGGSVNNELADCEAELVVTVAPGRLATSMRPSFPRID